MNEKQVKTILLAGVGGQGTILVSRILTQALMDAGYDVKMSEIHGMAQRGGSVSTTVRYGDKVQSPLIGKGGADILVAFEQMEAVRWSPWLKPDGVAVVNDYRIRPLPVAAGSADYPGNCLEALAEAFRVIALDAGAAAMALGNARVMNMVMLGALVQAFGMDEFDWASALTRHVPPRYLEINRKAFAKGRELAGVSA
ncbi:MAG TPA: indolepyruvate oxidoreductase subunit beta [Bacillota bacterium]|jgi:indolepyruvate ferredoxin oxidoreductase beta subunit|nr:indolepyruvate oxidoreductase subunit beta [Fastidiosipila sp.]HPX93264.1 indolepyruvate oxidoreductase subunit beta [Bacillota bacterium]HQB80923.1 indolepyruvate oxidoreductase subunit beta [Bacillota bacterium]